MDPVINSLTQSPFVKSLARVPAKGKSFTHGIRDNVPPFSMQKVVVKAWNNPSKTTQKATHKFKIPQFGTLNRAYLRIRMKNQEVTNASARHITDADNAALFTRKTVANDDNAAVVDSFYKTYQSNHRIPWIHPVQLMSDTTKGRPFGGGGTSQLHSGTQLDPETADLSATIGGGSISTSYASGLSVSAPQSLAGNASNAWNVLNILDSITLTSNGKIIENLYAETIPAEVVKMPEQMRDFYIKGMVGWSGGDDEGSQLSEPVYDHPWDPSATYRDAFGVLMNDYRLIGDRIHELRNQHADFIVPVTLSSLKSLPKNYQTKVCEKLELEVDMKPIERGFNKYTYADMSKDVSHEVELVLMYHNFHDNVESQLRAANYKMNVPTQIYGSNWFKEQGPFKVVSDTDPLVVALSSRNLATEIVIVAKSLSCGEVMKRDTLKELKSDYTLALQGDFAYDLEFKAGSKTLWTGSSLELQGSDSSDYDLSGRRLRGGDCGYGGSRSWKLANSRLNVEGTHAGWFDAKMGNGQYNQGGVDYSFSDNMCILKFGMQTTDEFYSGGVALQTISNPSLVIKPPKSRYGAKWLDRSVEFEVYVKYANMIEIDGESGAIRTTMNV